MGTIKKIIAIDPGSNGALVYEDSGSLISDKLSGDYAKVSELLSDICSLGPEGFIAFVEDVGKHMAGNAASSSIKLARNHQNIKTTLRMLGVETVDVSPQEWTKTIGVQVKDERTKEEKLRIRSLDKHERDKENARNRNAKKDKKTEKINALIMERIGGAPLAKYVVDAYGIYFYAERILGGK